MALLDETRNDIQDIDLSETRRKRFRIDGDNDRILELNTSDMGIIKRLNDLLPKLKSLQTDAAKELVFGDDMSDEEGMRVASDVLIRIDSDMRDIVDEIFDSNVSEVCAPEGSMYDPFNGKFRYEHIIETLVKLYEDNIKEETQKVAERVNKHTNKYTKRKK